jgi:hypothetical protein
MLIVLVLVLMLLLCSVLWLLTSLRFHVRCILLPWRGRDAVVAGGREAILLRERPGSEPQVVRGGRRGVSSQSGHARVLMRMNIMRRLAA